MSTSAVPAKRLLAKGLACANCKARKVKCDAIRPACTACRRSAKFRGEDPTAVRCCYFDKKKDSTGGAGGKAKRARMGKRRSGEEAIEADVVVERGCRSSRATPLAPVQPPPAPASPLSGPSTSTSTFPLPSTSCQPSTTGAPLPLLAPIAVYPAALPAFLGCDPLPAVPIPLAPFDPPTQSEFDAFLQSLALSPASIPALPPYGQPSALDSYETASPSSPSSTSSFSSSSSIGSDGSAFSSHLNSPFSLCEDYDLAFASSYPSYQPLPPALSSSSTAAKALPGWTPPTNEDPHAFVDAFLPTAHDCDKTLALPLFEERWAFNPLR